jgi:hypothetical protein
MIDGSANECLIQDDAGHMIRIESTNMVRRVCNWISRYKPQLELRRAKANSRRDNDPSAGSPTETLLRLHLPLSDKV